MKKTLSITTVRKVALIAVLIVSISFIVFVFYLVASYRNVLGSDVRVSDKKILLTNFNTSKFDRAVSRLEKRRNLEGPAEGIRDPFGDIPE